MLVDSSKDQSFPSASTLQALGSAVCGSAGRGGVEVIQVPGNVHSREKMRRCQRHDDHPQRQLSRVQRLVST